MKTGNVCHIQMEERDVVKARNVDIVIHLPSNTTSVVFRVVRNQDGAIDGGQQDAETPRADRTSSSS